MPTALIAPIIGGAIGIYSANKKASAQEDLYNTQYAAESAAAIANAEAAAAAAAIESEAIMAGAEAQAGGIIGAAQANAQSIRSGSAAQSEAAAAAADAAYSEAYRNVGLMQQEAAESLRKLDAEQTHYEEVARAKAAASGGEYTGSTKAYVEGMIAENTKQYGWLKNAYANQRRVAMSNAESERSAAYGYAQSLMTAGEAEAKAQLGAGSAMAGAAIQGGMAQAYATKQVGVVQQNAAYKAYGGPTSGQWFETAYQNAAAAKNRGASFESVVGAQPGYEYAAAKAYGMV